MNNKLYHLEKYLNKESLSSEATSVAELRKNAMIQLLAPLGAALGITATAATIITYISAVSVGLIMGYILFRLVEDGISESTWQSIREVVQESFRLWEKKGAEEAAKLLRKPKPKMPKDPDKYIDAIIVMLGGSSLVKMAVKSYFEKGSLSDWFHGGKVVTMEEWLDLDYKRDLDSWKNRFPKDDVDISCAQIVAFPITTNLGWEYGRGPKGRGIVLSNSPFYGGLSKLWVAYRIDGELRDPAFKDRDIPGEKKFELPIRSVKTDIEKEMEAADRELNRRKLKLSIQNKGNFVFDTSKESLIASKLKSIAYGNSITSPFLETRDFLGPDGVATKVWYLLKGRDLSLAGGEYVGIFKDEIELKKMCRTKFPDKDCIQLKKYTVGGFEVQQYKPGLYLTPNSKTIPVFPTVYKYYHLFKSISEKGQYRVTKGELSLLHVNIDQLSFKIKFIPCKIPIASSPL